MRFDELLTPALRQRMTEIARGLRRDATTCESLLWTQLRNRRLLGHKFRRQQPIGPFVADFYCDEAGLVVEIDGPIHARQRDADGHRDQLLSELGLRVLRITAARVEDNMPAVLREIGAALRELAVSPLPMGEGLG